MYCIAIPTNLLEIRYSNVHLYVIMFIKVVLIPEYDHLNVAWKKKTESGNVYLTVIIIDRNI